MEQLTPDTTLIERRRAIYNYTLGRHYAGFCLVLDKQSSVIMVWPFLQPQWESFCGSGFSFIK